MANIMVGLLLLLACSFALGFSLCMLYMVRRSKMILKRTRAMLDKVSDDDEAEKNVISGRLEVVDELLSILKFKKIK